MAESKSGSSNAKRLVLEGTDGYKATLSCTRNGVYPFSLYPYKGDHISDKIQLKFISACTITPQEMQSATGRNAYSGAAVSPIHIVDKEDYWRQTITNIRNGKQARYEKVTTFVGIQ
ncbi:MAG: hypothetical protein ACPGUV_09575, partial [Polyangiales bacterium]